MKTFLGSALALLLAGTSLPGLARAQDDDSDVRSIALRTHTLNTPYLDSDMQSRWFDFGGDTVVRTDQYIRLTPEKHSRTGWLFSRVPLTATNWEVEIEFKIHGESNLYGDGMAIWITKQRATAGPVFGSADNFEGLGIFIDTYKNNRPGTVFPYVMAMMGDGQTAYDQAHDGKDNELAGCSARGLRNRNNPTQVRITYFQEKSLKVELNYKPADGWTECFTVPDVKLPPVSYLGFSAETGELADNHDIISVQTKNLYSPSASSSGQKRTGNRNAQTVEPRPGARVTDQQEGGGWGWFFLKFVLFGVFCTVGYVGFTAYRAQRRQSRF